MSTTTTTLDRAQVAQLILTSLRDVLSSSGSDVNLAELSEETRLLGRSAVLDSMGLVTLIVDVEQQVEEQHGVALVLADERAMSQTRSPFLSVGTLADYVCQLAANS
jgi:acyl carrier protein